MLALVPILSSWMAPAAAPAAAWSAVGAHAWGVARGADACVRSGGGAVINHHVWAGCCSTRAPAPAMGGRRFRPQPKPQFKDNTPINEGIDFEEMRVMIDKPGEADEMLGVMSKADAIAEAQKLELDLVLIAAKTDPPVCKIVSYDKFRYAKEKKKKEQKAAASKGQELKELKMSYKIGEHDYEVRKKQALRFLAQGNKVKFSMLFRGREITHSDVGQKIMLDMAASLDDIGVLDANPKIMGRQMIMMISPKATV